MPVTICGLTFCVLTYFPMVFLCSVLPYGRSLAVKLFILFTMFTCSHNTRFLFAFNMILSCVQPFPSPEAGHRRTMRQLQRLDIAGQCGGSCRNTTHGRHLARVGCPSTDTRGFLVYFSIVVPYLHSLGRAVLWVPLTFQFLYLVNLHAGGFLSDNHDSCSVTFYLINT